MVVGVFSTLVAVGLAFNFLIPPILPRLQAAKQAMAPTAQPKVPRTSRTDRERAAVEAQLRYALARRPAPPAIRPSQLRVDKNRAVEPSVAVRSAQASAERPGIVAGFYVNWQDNSLTSLTRHVRDLDWVIGEWAFVASNGESLLITPDSRVLFEVEQLSARDRPRLFAMVSNFDRKTGRFESAPLRRLLATPTSRQRAATQLVDACMKYGFAGVTVDFEEVPDDLQDDIFAFMRLLRAGLTPGGRLLTSAIAVSTDEALVRRFAAANDYLFLMLYDEHYGKGDPGPVASQPWFDAKLSQFLRWIPPSKIIVTLGAYGYEWNDAGGRLNGSTVTFQDVMQLAHDSHATIQFDSVAFTPFLSWDDADSVSHTVWFLDGVTAWNQTKSSLSRGVAGAAIWRLGSEDPSLWTAISKDVALSTPSMLATIPSGYDPDITGDGELLRLAGRPSRGKRTVVEDSSTGLVTHERYLELPAPWRVERFGGNDTTKIALTFDDGPDPRYTSAILDTLKSRGVHATFFIVGRQADANPALLRRIFREGHEIGNHTYTHPNLALASPLVAKLEITATGRLLETILNRRTALFRPPYFGDAEPTTSDELIPVGLATDLGYLTVGVHIDSEDWKLNSPDSILATVLDRLPRGNVILLHDSGGDRRATVAVLGAMIDSLLAEGRQPVLVSELAGISRDEAMPLLTSRTLVERGVDLIAFGTLGVTEWLLYYAFLTAVVLGAVRLVIVIALALWQRRTSRLAAAPPTFAPPVTVIVPAYNESRVIKRTIETLLSQSYDGPLTVIIVDDGSPDDTSAIATAAFAHDARVSVVRQANAGKSAALNTGVQRATTEILICLDADTQFEPSTIRALVQPLSESAVGAVAGNAKVGNRINIVTRWQALEYVTSQNLDRRAFSTLNCITVVPGAVGAWRRSAVLAAGGFTNDTLAEDQDLTIRLRALGHRIAYTEHAVAWTEAPDTMRSLAKQRFRWSFGTLQCAWKHRRLLFNPRYGTLGSVALPNTWLFQLLLTALSPLADLLFVYGLLSVWLTYSAHGSSYALSDLEIILAFYAVFLLTDWLGALIAFAMEPEEERGLAWLIMLQRFAYRQLMYSVVVKSIFAAVRGGVVGWGTLERKATVELPV